MYPVYSAPPSYGMPAEAANLEYSIISAILGGGSPESGSSGSPAATQAPPPVASSSYAPPQAPGLSTATWPAEPIQTQYAGQPNASSYAGAAPGYGEQPPLAIPPSDTTLSASSVGPVPSEYIAPTATAYQGTYPAQPSQAGPSQYSEYASDQSQAQAQAATATSQHQQQTSAGPSAYRSPPQSFLVRPRRTPVSSPTRAWNSPSLSALTAADNAVQSVYRNVTKGYDYTEGYHFLMKHLSRRCVFSRCLCAAQGCAHAVPWVPHFSFPDVLRATFHCGSVLCCAASRLYPLSCGRVTPLATHFRHFPLTFAPFAPLFDPWNAHIADSRRTTSFGSSARSRSSGRRSSRCRCQ